MMRRAAFLCVTAVFCGVALAGKAPARLEIVPDGERASEAALEGSTFVFENDAFRARLKQIDDAGRQAFFREKTDAVVDPFAADPRSRGFVTFLLELESKTEGSLVFQPQNCQIKTNRTEIELPLDLPTIEASFSVMDREMPPAYRQVRPALFDGERVLRYGEKATGLLVFRGLDPKTRKLGVEIQLTTPRGEVTGFTVPYVRAPKKKPRKEGR